MKSILKETNLADLPILRKKHRDYYRTGITRDLKFRRQMLDKLYHAIQKEEKALIEALYRDLRKSEFEAFSNEIGLVYTEITHAKKNLKKWAKTKRIKASLATLPGKAWVTKEPYGNVLIMGPWNYPMQLLFLPLVGAMAAGNTAILKPSEMSPHTAMVCQRLIKENFPEEYLCTVQGGPEVSQHLVEQDFDYLFFTGSVSVGKKIMSQAAELLTPLTLELGGKSPTFVDSTADLDLAARKIAFGKFNNAGQTCVAPDYVLVHQSVADDFLKALKSALAEFFPEGPKSSAEYGRMIHKQQFLRMEGYLQGSEIFVGGQTDPKDLFVAPTILYPVDWDHPVMEEEIFGPILPVFAYEDLNEAITRVQSFPKPLALYLFTKDQKVQEKIISEIPFGGGAINSTIIQVASPYLPFGGVGPSGMGKYHGEASFDTFSHAKSILKQPGFFDIPMSYPHKKLSMRILKWLLK